jgi:hypothetical protein
MLLIATRVDFKVSLPIELLTSIKEQQTVKYQEKDLCQNGLKFKRDIIIIIIIIRSQTKYTYCNSFTISLHIIIFCYIFRRYMGCHQAEAQLQVCMWHTLVCVLIKWGSCIYKNICN